MKFFDLGAFQINEQMPSHDKIIFYMLFLCRGLRFYSNSESDYVPRKYFFLVHRQQSVYLKTVILVFGPIPSMRSKLKFWFVVHLDGRTVRGRPHSSVGTWFGPWINSNENRTKTRTILPIRTAFPPRQPVWKIKFNASILFLNLIGSEFLFRLSF